MEGSVPRASPDPHRAAIEAALLGELREALGAVAVTPMPAGGTPSRLVRMDLEDGSAVAVKYHIEDDALVDGHDLDTFRRQPEQIRRVRDELPGLRPYYTEVLREVHLPRAAAFVMPYHEGEPLSSSVSARGGSAGELLRAIAHLVQVLTEHGYAARAGAAPPGYFKAVQISRVRRRLPLVLQALPREVAATDKLIINGRRCLPAADLLELAASRPSLLARLQPPSLSAPVHGDAVLNNFLVEPAPPGDPGAPLRFKAIDPRGTVSPWDPMYDFAKMLFSLSVMDAGTNAGFSIEIRPDGIATACSVRPRDAGGLPASREAAGGFLDALAAVDAFDRLLARADIQWRWRLLFDHAMHCLAFAACRFWDDPERSPGAACGRAAQEMALGFYLAGVLLLSDLLDADASDTLPSGEAHIGLLYPGVG